MTTIHLLCATVSVAASLGRVPAVAQDASVRELPRLLFLTQSAGFVHSVVERPAAGELSHAERALTAAADGRLAVTCTQDAAAIDAELLAGYDAVLFYTTGELPMSAEGKSALIDWVRGGGAFCGSHCATDTFYEYAPYQRMIGGVFDGHPWHEEVGVAVERPEHPAAQHLGTGFRITDEIYQFRDFARFPLVVILALDATSVDLSRGKREDGDYALSWCKPYGRGRVFYTALGHREDVWTDARFLEHLLSGIEWAVAGPDLPVPAPPSATVLFDGESLHGWTTRTGEPAAWRVVDGALEVVPGSGDVLTTAGTAGDFLLHVEFLVPAARSPEEEAARGNSGVYVEGRYEIQVLDSLGRAPGDGECGAIYGQHAPAVDACRPAGEWQSFDIGFRSPSRESTAGPTLSAARATVWLNGIRIHDDVALSGPTAGGLGEDEPGVGPLLLQDHGQPVRYRSIWFLPR